MESSALADGQIGGLELPGGQHLDLVGALLGNLPSPHGDGLPGDPEGVRQSLVSPAEVFDDLFKGGLDGHVPECNPADTVRQPGYSWPRQSIGKLAYMADYSKEPGHWEVRRGRLIRSAREARGETQEWLGRLLGLTRVQATHIESGKTRTLRMESIKVLMRELGLSLTDLTQDKRVIEAFAKEPNAVRDQPLHPYGEMPDDVAALHYARELCRLPPEVREAIQITIETLVARHIKVERNAKKKDTRTEDRSPRPDA